MQPMDFWARSGGGLAPILRAGFFSDVAAMETPILEDTAMKSPFCLGSSPSFGDLKIGWRPGVVQSLHLDFNFGELLITIFCVSFRIVEKPHIFKKPVRLIVC